MRNTPIVVKATPFRFVPHRPHAGVGDRNDGCCVRGEKISAGNGVFSSGVAGTGESGATPDSATATDIVTPAPVPDVSCATSQHAKACFCVYDESTPNDLVRNFFTKVDDGWLNSG